MIIRVRRGLEANRLSYTPQVGEPTFTTDEKKLYIGDGVTPGGILVDLSGSGIVQTIVAGTNITVDNTDPANPIVSSAGGGGAVDSVNTQTGDVVLDADDISDAGTTNKYVTAAEKTKLSNTSGVNTGDQDISGIATNAADLAAHEADTANPHAVTKAQVGLSAVPNTDFTAAVAANTAKISYTDAAKVAGIEDGADVTDTANVTAAGALMDSEVTNLAQVKAFDETDYATAAQGATADSAVQPGDLATVATTGDYDDLTDKPTIPTSVDALNPSQAGQSGKFLKTNGTNATWEAIPGGGDMLASTYDPQAIGADAFDQDNMTDGTTNKNYTATEQTKLGHISVSQAVNLDTMESDLSGHIANTSNPHSVTKGQVGLGNADNTSDATKLAATLLAVYPVGSIYTSVVSTNPGTLFGGTWAAFGAGRVMVGLNSGDADFDTAEETGGAKTHTLTEAEMPAHDHGGVTSSNPAYNTNAVYSDDGTVDHFAHNWDGAFVGNDNTYRDKTIHSHTVSSDGGGGAHNNLQPYIVVYMWKRTA